MENRGIFTVVFYKGETRWCRLTLTGQLAFITYLYNMISFRALIPAKTLGCFWTNSNHPDQLFWVLCCWGVCLTAEQGTGVFPGG